MGKLTLEKFEGDKQEGQEPFEVKDAAGDRLVMDSKDELTLPIDIAEQIVADCFGLAELLLKPELKSHVLRIYILATDLDKEIAASKAKIATSKAKKLPASNAGQKRCSDLERAKELLYNAAAKLREGQVDQAVEFINNAGQLFQHCAWQPGRDARERAQDQHRARDQKWIDLYKANFADLTQRYPDRDPIVICREARVQVADRIWAESASTEKVAKELTGERRGQLLKDITKVLFEAGLIEQKSGGGWSPKT